MSRLVLDALLILIVSVSSVHMGLTDAIKKVVRFDVPVIGCVKCLTFWGVLIWSVITGMNILHAIVLSFALAYCAVWLDLFLGFADNIYLQLYAKYQQAAEAAENGTETVTESKADTMPKM